MYGYILPDKKTIKQEEFVLYSAFYCGVCVAIGEEFGQILRYTTSYDIAFFAALIFDQNNSDAQLVLNRCIGNPFNKKPIIKRNELMMRIVDTNIILAYYKILDNLIDGKRGAKSAQRFVKKHFEAAAKREPIAAQICQKAQEKLAKIEKGGEKSVDIAADCFAGQLRDLAANLLDNADENALGLFYNVGKFVYLADALDDIDEDFKSGGYNPFLNSLPPINDDFSRQKYIENYRGQISFALNSTINRAIQCFNESKFNQSYGLIENIIYYGLRKKCGELLESTKKLARPKI